jgi:hypothetical protein
MRYLGWGERQARSVANPAARLIGSSSKPDAPAVKREAEEDWGRSLPKIRACSPGPVGSMVDVGSTHPVCGWTYSTGVGAGEGARGDGWTRAPFAFSCLPPALWRPRTARRMPAG